MQPDMSQWPPPNPYLGEQASLPTGSPVHRPSAGWLRGAGLAAALCILQAVAIGAGAFGLLLFNEMIMEAVDPADIEIWAILGIQLVAVILLVAGSIRITNAVYLWAVAGAVLSLGLSGYFLIRYPIDDLSGWPVFFAVVPILLLVVIVVLRLTEPRARPR